VNAHQITLIFTTITKSPQIFTIIYSKLSTQSSLIDKYFAAAALSICLPAQYLRARKYWRNYGSTFLYNIILTVEKSRLHHHNEVGSIFDELAWC
jgi:hypothetical protein